MNIWIIIDKSYSQLFWQLWQELSLFLAAALGKG